MFSWFDTRPCVRFGEELAKELLESIGGSTKARDAKFAARVERALVKADRKVRDFRASERMNVWKRSRLANAFLWRLRDGGCSPEYAQELTEWLTFRL